MKHTLIKRTLIKRIIIFLGVALAILGFYGPWVTSARRLAALTYNAIDLAEFSRFLARAGMAHLTRELFLVPIVAAALALALWASQPGQVSRPARYALTLAAAIFALIPLPPFSSGMSPLAFLSLVAYRSAEDRGAFWLSVAGLIGLGLVFAFGRRVAERWCGLALVALTAIGAVPAAWQFFARALPAISTAYGSPARVEWGLVVTMVGLVFVAVAGVSMAVKPEN